MTQLYTLDSRPRGLAISLVGAGEGTAMAYKRGVLVFVFLVSAFSVYHFSANLEGSGAVHKMKRSLASDMRAAKVVPSDILTAFADDGLNGRRLTSRTY